MARPRQSEQDPKRVPTPRLRSKPRADERRQEMIADAIERVIPRRQLRVEVGDICIRYVRGLKSARERDIYDLTEEGHGPIPGRYTNFDYAVAAGDDLARQRRVRLFFCEPEGLPLLLRDYRPR